MIDSHQIRELLNLIQFLGDEVEKIKSRKFNYEKKIDGSPLSEADLLVNDKLTKFISKTKYKNIKKSSTKRIRKEYKRGVRS